MRRLDAKGGCRMLAGRHSVWIEAVKDRTRGRERRGTGKRGPVVLVNIKYAWLRAQERRALSCQGRESLSSRVPHASPSYRLHH